MTCVYILFSQKLHKFYFGSAKDLRNRLSPHNQMKVPSTKLGVPWVLVWYGAFLTESEARSFELYLKSGSGKSFAYKRLIFAALEKDFQEGRKSSPKSKT